jgi:acylphosphatase
MTKVRAHVLIHGRVQGVCFRMETQRAAKAHRVTGWVRNLADGRVEALFEGDPADVDSMLQWCQTGAPMARVDKVAVEWEPYTGEYGGFGIAF